MKTGKISWNPLAGTISNNPAMSPAIKKEGRKNEAYYLFLRSS